MNLLYRTINPHVVIASTVTSWRRGANAHSLANFFWAALVIESKGREVP